MKSSFMKLNHVSTFLGKGQIEILNFLLKNGQIPALSNGVNFPLIL